MKNGYNAYLLHIIDAIKNIEEFTKECSKEKFTRTKIIQDSVIRNLEIIGEAAKHVPAAVRRKYVSIEWKRIAGMRDILIHEYFGVDIDRVWQVLKVRIPELKKEINNILRNQSGK
ncbi:DUF86 domain-containing protein [bacterium]|nr:MAG: DUF86 domain-containing protein [bacterium]